MKRLISIVLTLLILATAIPFATAFAAEAPAVDKFDAPREIIGINPTNATGKVKANNQQYWLGKVGINTDAALGGDAGEGDKVLTYANNAYSGSKTDSWTGISDGFVDSRAINGSQRYYVSQYSELLDGSNGFKLSYDATMTTIASNMLTQKIYNAARFGNVSIMIVFVGNDKSQRSASDTTNCSLSNITKLGKTGMKLAIAIGDKVYYDDEYIVGSSDLVNCDATTQTLLYNAVSAYFLNTKMKYELSFDALSEIYTAKIVNGGKTYEMTASGSAADAKGYLSVFTHSGRSGTKYENIVFSASSTIAAANITIGSNITFNAFTNQLAFPEGYEMEFTRNGKNGLETVNAETATTTNKVGFAVSPQCMNDEIVMKLKNADGDVVAVQSGSVRGYVEDLMEANLEDDNLQTLCKDLLAYGAAAQKYKNYDIENLMFNIEDATTFDATDLGSDLAKSNAQDDSLVWKSASVYFDNVNRLRITFDSTIENLTITVAKGEAEETVLKTFENGGAALTVLSNGINATDFDTVYTFKAYSNYSAGGTNTSVASISYSVRTYVNSKKDDTEFGELAQRTWMYGVAADAYASAK